MYKRWTTEERQEQAKTLRGLADKTKRYYCKYCKEEVYFGPVPLWDDERRSDDNHLNLSEWRHTHSGDGRCETYATPDRRVKEGA
jgi:hypothetical protein